MRRKLTIAILFIALLFQSGCAYGYCGPDDNANEIWIADDVDFYFGSINEEAEVCGKAVLDGEVIEISAAWSLANEIEILPYQIPEGSLVEHRLLFGQIKKIIGDKYCISIKKDSKYNKLFPGYEAIELTKYDVSEVEWVDGWPVPVEK